MDRTLANELKSNESVLVNSAAAARDFSEHNQSNPQLRILANVLRMHFAWVFVLSGVLAIGSVVLIMKFWKPVYEAKAYLRVIQNPGYFQVIPEKFQTQTNAKDELAPIKSDLLLNRVLEIEEIRKLPSIASSTAKTKQLGKMISFNSAGGQELFEVACESTSPQEAATIASQVTNVYLDFFRQYRDNRLRELSQDLSDEITNKNRQIDQIKQDLATQAGLRQGSAIDNSVYDPDGEYLADLQKSQTKLQVELKALLAERELIKMPMPPSDSSPTAAAPPPATADALKTTGDASQSTADASSSPSADATQQVPAKPILPSNPVAGANPPTDIVSRVETSPEVVRLKSERSKLSVDRRDKLSRGLGENHPDIRAIDMNLARIDEELAQTKKFLRNIISAQPVVNQVVGVDPNSGQPVLQDIRNAAALDSKIAGLKTQLDFYDVEINKQRARIKENNQQYWQFKSKQQDLDRATGELDRLLDAESTLHFRKLSLPYQITREGSEVVPIPDAPLEDYPLKILAIAVAASLALPFGLAFLLERRAQRISQPEQLSQQLPYGLVGEVAAVPYRRIGARATSPRLIREQYIYQESVDKISTLLALTGEQDFQVIAITSAVSHEGKSTLASQLAISLARSTNQEILLIDADLRSPVQHRLFETSNQVGLADVVHDVEDWASAIFDTRIPNLHIMPAGISHAKPASFFVNNSWERLLAQVRPRFRTIIVDCPPVLSASESLAICKACTRTLLCVLRDISRADSLHRAHAQLTAAKVRVMGCVFGGIDQSDYSYRYGGEYETSDRS